MHNETSQGYGYHSCDETDRKDRELRESGYPSAISTALVGDQKLLTRAKGHRTPALDRERQKLP